MTAQDIHDLIHLYDSVQELKTFLGVANLAIGYSDGILGELSRIEDIISRHTVLDADERIEVLDSGMSVEDRAKRLLGTTHSESA